MTQRLVRLFEYAVPDPYIYAVALTILTAVLALAFAPHHDAATLLGSWYKGIFDILQFALQMILILVTGYALALSKPVSSLLDRLATWPRTPKAAVSLTFLISAVACWLNWGFGLVVAALLARAIAARMRIDFGWLVAAAYSGFLIWASGLSSSIALAQATPGNKLNIVQAMTGHMLPLSATIFAPFNLVPVVVLVIVLPFVFAALEPKQGVFASPQCHPEPLEGRAPPTLARTLNNTPIFNIVIAAAALGYIVVTWTQSGIAPDINSVIAIFLALGLLLHWRPVAYVDAINTAAGVTGPLILQYPIYGGIMGMMSGTGLAAVIAAWFGTFATGHTLPFWSYVSSIVISFFVPSGGGHWAVQGPFAVPAAVKLHASLGATAMGVATGEEVANMLQPFWALPLLAIAGIGLQRVLAFTAIVFCIAFVVFGAALLLLA